MSELTDLRNIIINYDNGNAYQAIRDIVFVVGRERVIAAIDEIIEQQSIPPAPLDFRMSQIESRMSAIERALGLKR